jgi:hypothetical protein
VGTSESEFPVDSSGGPAHARTVGYKEESMAKSISIRDVAIGFALGAAAASLLPMFLPQTDARKRDLVKASLKRTMRAVDGGVEKLAELRENVEDLLAEVSAEMAEEAGKSDAPQDTSDRSQSS